MKLLFCNDFQDEIVQAVRQALPEHETTSAPVSEVAAAVRDVDIIIPARTEIDAEIMDAAPKLKLIQQIGVGMETVELPAAWERGIPVANVPADVSGAGRAVAEIALFHMIGAGRNFPALSRLVSAGSTHAPFGHSLYGARVCLVGLGGIGRPLALLLRSFDCDVVGVKRSRDADLSRELGLTALYTSERLTDAVRECQFLVVAVPLTPETENLIDARVLAALPEGAVVVNVARGPVVNRAALLDALDSGRVSVAGLDVFWKEPVDPNDDLFSHDVLATPHCATSCDLFLREGAAAVADNVRRMERGEPLRFEFRPPARK